MSNNNNDIITILSIMYEHIYLIGKYFILENMYFSKVKYWTKTIYYLVTSNNNHLFLEN